MIINLEKIKGVIQLDGVPGGEGNYIGVISREVEDFKGGYYSDNYDITHYHGCSNIFWAKNDCFSNGDYKVREENNDFFNDKKWSGVVLEGCHYSTMDILKEHLIQE